MRYKRECWQEYRRHKLEMPQNAKKREKNAKKHFFYFFGGGGGVKFSSKDTPPNPNSSDLIHFTIIKTHNEGQKEKM